VTDIAKVVGDKINQMVNDGLVDKVIEDAIEKAVTDKLQSVLTGYGDFSKNLETQIQEAVCSKDLGLPAYHHTICRVLRTQMDAYFEKDASEQFANYVQELLSKYPKEIKLTDLIERFKEYAADEDRSDNYYSEDEFSGTCKIVHNSGALSKRFDIYLDIERGKDKYECEFQLRCDEDGLVWAVQIGQFKPYKPGKQLFTGPLFHFEAFCFHAYTNKAKVILDTEEYDEY